MADREGFVRRWRKKADESADAFDRFFAAWIALVIAARPYLREQALSQPGQDRKAILAYFERNENAVVEVLAKLPDETKWLASRSGTGTGRPIVDVFHFSPKHLRQTFDTLALVWLGQVQRKPKWVATAAAELVNHIRNHMFHGVKDPDDLADQALIERVNPIVTGMLAIVEKDSED